MLDDVLFGIAKNVVINTSLARFEYNKVTWKLNSFIRCDESNQSISCYVEHLHGGKEVASSWQDKRIIV